MAKKTLPSCRVDENTIHLLRKALERFNEQSLSKISLQEFRRLSYEFFSRFVLAGKDLKQLLELR